MELALKLPFTGNISKAQDDTYEVLKNKVQSMKVEFLKDYLREKKVNFDDKIDDYKELENVINGLDKETKQETLAALKEFNLQFESVVENLHDGHTGEFQKFIKNTKDKVTTYGKMPVLAMAGSTLVKIAPIMPLKIIAGAATTAGIVYKGSKAYIDKRRNERTESYDFILKEFEISKDSDGNIIDTRFSENMQSNIRTFLKENNHEVNGDSYKDLRSTIEGLDNNEKRKLINFINNQKGNPIDVDQRLKDIERPLKQRIKEDVAVPLVLAIASGVGIATSLNTISPAILSTPVNTIFGAKIVSLFTKNKIAKWIGGGVGGAGTIFGSNIPFLNNIFEIESLAVGAVGGAVVGGVKVIKDHIFKGVKGTKERMEMLKQIEEANQKDKELYGEEIDESPEDTNKKIIRSIMVNYFKELGVNVPNNGENPQDFHDAVEKLNDEDKKRVLRALNNLDKVSKKDRETAQDKLIRIGKTVFWVTACGLAGLGIVDIARPGTINQILGRTSSGNTITSTSTKTDKSNSTKTHEIKANENNVRHKTAGMSDGKTISSASSDESSQLTGFGRSKRHREGGLSSGTSTYPKIESDTVAPSIDNSAASTSPTPTTNKTTSAPIADSSATSVPSTDKNSALSGFERSKRHREGGLSSGTSSTNTSTELSGFEKSRKARSR